MTKTVSYFSRHKRDDLAKRKAKTLARDFPKTWRVKIIRRNADGKVSKRGTFYEFKFTPPKSKLRKMYRLIAVYPYAVRDKANKSKVSPSFKDYSVRGWFKTKKAAQAQVGEYEEIAKAGAKATGDYLPYGKESSHQIVALDYRKEDVDHTEKDGPEEEPEA